MQSVCKGAVSAFFAPATLRPVHAESARDEVPPSTLRLLGLHLLLTDDQARMRLYNRRHPLI